jgi:hypothetical protein
VIEPLPRQPYQAVLLLLDEQLTAVELAELVELLRCDERVRRQAAALLLQIGALGEMARESRDDARLPPPRRAAPWRTVAAVVLGATLAAAAALLVVGLRGPESRAPAHRAPLLARTVAHRFPAKAIAAAPSRRRAVLVRGSDPEVAGDVVLVAHIERLGFDVVDVIDTEMAPGDFGDADLVVISASALGRVVRARFPPELRDAPVPIVTCEGATFDLLGMTGPRVEYGLTARSGFGSTAGHTGVEIESVGHPLAAGLRGPVDVATASVALTWGVPSRDAIRVAHLGTNHTLAVQFAYEEGAEMAGRRAPARRVGCFVTAQAAEQLTTQGWALFDAGVRWASGL